MSSDLGYYRHPCISGSEVVFVSEDDLWTVRIDSAESRAVTARRLTANPGTFAFPRFSPDGTELAFTGSDDGPGEVYVMAAGGGAPRRLTWMGSNTHVVGWTRDGSGILAATDWQQPFAGSMRIVEVPLDGGPPISRHYGPARAVSTSPASGGVVIGRNSGDPARWKRYRGGTAGTIWIDRKGDGAFKELIKLDGNLANPMWIGRRVYFLSDHEGHGNLYSCTPTGRGLTRHTSHDEFYVRFPSTDGKRIVYHAGADLYLFDPATGAFNPAAGAFDPAAGAFDPSTDGSVKIDARIRSSQSPQIRRFTNATYYMESFDLHPKGHSVTSIHRGGMYSMGLWEGAPVRYGSVSESRYRLSSWLPDGKRLVALTDEDGDEELIVFAADQSTPPRKIRGDFGRPTGLYVAPGEVLAPEDDDQKKSGKKTRGRKSKKKKAPHDRILLTNHRQEVVLVDLDSGKSKVLDRSPHHRISGAAWSPDSKWVAYSYSSSYRTGVIRLHEVATGKKFDIARQEDFFDGYPNFDPEGKYLYFISWRTFNPVHDSIYFDLGFPKGSRPFLVTLHNDTVSPFDTATMRLAAPGGSEETNEDEGHDGNDENKKDLAFRIDLDGIEDRVLAFPVPEGRYGRVMGVRGRALFTQYPVMGSLHDEDDSAEGVLDYWNFKRNKSGRAADKVTDFALSLDARVIGLISSDRLRAVPADFKEDPDKAKDDYSRDSGWVDLDRIPIAVVPAAEWTQMYQEAWRLQRDHFWHPDMSGTDWEGVRMRYLPVLERVGSRSEFSDLMWEVQGELGTSHCYELGGDYRPRPNWRQGFLGADLEYNTRRKHWEIRRIPRGDSWKPSSRSPLSRPGLDLRVGDRVLAIGGEPVDARTSPYERLVNMADSNVRLTIQRRRGRRTTTDTVTVQTLGNETPLRYRDWVEENRRRVHEDSDGSVGYVHIPDMGATGFAEFHRYYGPESDRDGLIIDVRFNRGGNVSQLLLEKLLRRRIGYDMSRWSEPLPYPDAAPMGPMVALTNEYAGSDGDIFCHAFKLLGLGPLIGKRTWGGVVGIWPRAALVDGTVTTQPEFAYWFEDVGYDVENYGTDPDIEVDIRPQDYAAGLDTQLDRGLETIRSIIRKKGPLKPDFNRIRR
jgi:tricorn protease